MDNNNFDQTYQQPSQQPIYQQVPQKTPGNGAAVASMVCGILSIVFCWCYGIVGLILGIIALAMYSKSKRLNGGLVIGMATAGLVCGIIGSIISGLMLIYFIVVIFIIGATSSFLYY